MRNIIVGCAVTGYLYMCLYKHLFGLIGNVHVANAVKNYELHEFAFLILEIVPQNTESAKFLTLLSRKVHYIKTLRPQYNIALLTSNSKGWKQTEKSLGKMRENYSEERRKQVAGINKGKSLSFETRALMREAALKRKPMSIETRLKCAVNVRPVTIIDLDGKNLLLFSSIISAAEFLGCNEKTIRRVLKADGVIKQKFLVTDTINT
jgi:group I intron endonuclease